MYSQLTMALRQTLLVLLTVNLAARGCCANILSNEEDIDPDRLEDTNEGTESQSNHALSSCPWTGPPENGFNFRTCAVGFCKGEAGTYTSQNSIRYTRCNKHYMLINGKERDTCVNGAWTSSGHECVPCGRSPRNFDYYANGVPHGNSYNSSRGDFPWMAALFKRMDGKKNWSLLCSGTLISPFLVLTAAHCLNINGNILKPEDIKVGLGKLSSNFNTEDKGSKIMTAKELVYPERYVGSPRYYELDLGLVVLEKRVSMSSQIMPACVNWRGMVKPQEGERGVIAGWDSMNENGLDNEYLKWVYQKYISYSECVKIVQGQDIRYLSDKFCADEVYPGMNPDGGYGGSGLTLDREGNHYVSGVLSTRTTLRDKPLHLYTDLLNTMQRNWLSEQWDRLYPPPPMEVDLPTDQWDINQPRPTTGVDHTTKKDINQPRPTTGVDHTTKKDINQPRPTTGVDHTTKKDINQPRPKSKHTPIYHGFTTTNTVAETPVLERSDGLRLDLTRIKIFLESLQRRFSGF